MGSSIDKQAGLAIECTLCHKDCRNPVSLRCGHCFCQACIGELWSSAPDGPHYCPDCNYDIEHRNLPDFADTGPTTALPGRLTPSWNLGRTLASRYSEKKSLLGKRAASSTNCNPYRGGHRLGPTQPRRMDTSSDPSSESAVPPKKRMPSSASPQDEDAPSVRPPADDAPSPTAQTTPSHAATPPAKDGRYVKMRMDANHTSEEGGHNEGTPPADQASTSSTSQRGSPGPNAVPPFTTVRSAPGADPRIACHYCPSSEERPAVKTCLVCGASMCPLHLRVHLDSPVFQSHPLVPAVADVSPWRCQEHQEMNRIYCRGCAVCVCTVCTVIGSHRDHQCVSIKEAEMELRGTLKEEMKKMQAHEQTILNRISDLTERKQRAQGVVEGVCASVQQHYQAMREAVDQEEQQALRCIAQEESRVLGSLGQQLGALQESLSTLQSSFSALQGLADATGASRTHDQAFIMEYKNVSKRFGGLSNPVESMEPPKEVNQAYLDCLQHWTERRLDKVIISLPHRDPFKLLYGINPSLDPNTAHPKLLLSDGNRRVTYGESQQSYPEREARFSIFPQVLACDALTQGRSYWEVEVPLDDGRWKVGVCDGQIVRKGQKDACRMGFYPNSWCLICEKGKVEALHDKTASPVLGDGLKRLGVLLDFEEGSLSFFNVSEEGALSLLYCFQYTFSEPLYPALAVSKTQLSICDLFQRPAED